MRVLITNTALDKFAGTECYVFDVCRALAARGHDVAAFSPRPGRVAAAMRDAGLTVAGDLAAVPWEPDVIHGHHEWETTLAAVRWPGAGLLSFCHGAQPWQEAPCRAPWVHRHVVVGEPCRARLVEREGIDASGVVTLLNFVDLGRFALVKTPGVPPRRVLVFSNHIKRGRGLELIAAACAAARLELEVAGSGAGQVSDDPRAALVRADIVLAQGRCALEAMATGCAVVLCGTERLGPLVDPGVFDELRLANFGFTCLADELSADALLRRFRAVTVAGAAEVTRMVREQAGLDAAITQLEAWYADARAAALANPPLPEVVAAFAAGRLADATGAWKLGREAQALHAQSIEQVFPETLPTADTEVWLRKAAKLMMTQAAPRKTGA
ncbi:MAG: glycosyltransferase [Verrucomicrobiaceae bacterium]|nr:glycosyltransferase [Verrucomicrobiaceae bacterium]